nr:NADH dehydrogenase subunit 4L [Linognathus africanus]
MSCWLMLMIFTMKLSFTSSMVVSLISLEFISCISFLLLYLTLAPTLSSLFFVITLSVFVIDGVLGVTLLMASTMSVATSIKSMSVMNF